MITAVRKEIMYKLSKNKALGFLTLLAVAILSLARSFMLWLPGLAAIEDGAFLLMTVSAAVWLIGRIYGEIFKKPGTRPLKWLAAGFGCAGLICMIIRLSHILPNLAGLELAMYLSILAFSAAWALYSIAGAAELSLRTLCAWILAVCSCGAAALIFIQSYVSVYSGCAELAAQDIDCALFIIVNVISLAGIIASPVYAAYESISFVKASFRK